MTAHPHEQLAIYRDLSASERQAVDAHVAGCADCRATLAAYAGQDQVLARLPGLRPGPQTRPWQGSPARRGRTWLGRLGDGLVLAGVCALLWMLALQIQFLRQPAVATLPDGVPASAVTEPGLTLPPTRLQPPSPWLHALPWIGGSLLAVGGLFILGRQRPWTATVGGVLAGLFLISAIPPLSAVPNPAGLYYRLVGGYSYDPQLPFRNQFLIRGEPEALLSPHLKALIGEVGLSPLDPVQPLASYEILRVGLHPTHKDVALVTTRFVYADGSARVYPVPLLEPALRPAGFWLSGWREDGLERLRSDHLALPGQPFAGEDAPIRVGPAQVLPLPAAANRLDEVNPGHWLWTSTRVQRLVWAPDGSRFLAAMELDPGRRQLWSIAFDGAEPTLIATANLVEYGWSYDGEAVVYTVVDPAATEVNPRRPYAIQAQLAEAGAAPRTLATGLPTGQLPGLTQAGAWFFNDDVLWVAPLDGSEPVPAATALAAHRPAGAPRPSPDGTRVLFACGGAACLLSLDGDAPALRTLDGYRMSEAAWTADGRLAAVIDRNPNFQSPVALVVVDREGVVMLKANVAPQEATEPPQWTPDGRAVFVQTYPFNGRRLIAVDVPSGKVVDLSQEHWDAYYSLSPDGTRLLMNNGRGYFWMAEVRR